MIRPARLTRVIGRTSANCFGQRLERRQRLLDPAPLVPGQPVQSGVHGVGPLAADPLAQTAAGVGGRGPGGAPIVLVAGALEQPGIDQVRDHAREHRRVDPLGVGQLGEPDRPVAVDVSSTEMRVGVSPASSAAAVGRSRRDSRPIAARSVPAVSMSSVVGMTGMRSLYRPQ